MIRNIAFFTIFLSLCLLIVPQPTKAQTIQDRQRMSAAIGGISAHHHAPHYVQLADQSPDTEYAWVLSKLFLFYKRRISSQDMGACNFTPSCSEYAMLSVKQLGAAKGIINGFDRLTRCHPIAAKYYPRDSTGQKLADPVWIIR